MRMSPKTKKWLLVVAAFVAIIGSVVTAVHIYTSRPSYKARRIIERFKSQGRPTTTMDLFLAELGFGGKHRTLGVDEAILELVALGEGAVPTLIENLGEGEYLD